MTVRRRMSVLRLLLYYTFKSTADEPLKRSPGNQTVYGSVGVFHFLFNDMERFRW